MKVCSFCHRCFGDAASYCTEEDHPPLSETLAGDPEMIAGYRLETLLESTAKSATYLARQTESGQRCKIKIVHAKASGGDALLSEANLAAGVFHENVADIYEAGSLESGEVFVVGADAECQTLRERLDSGSPLDLLTSILIVRQAAEALHALHLQGVLHRAVRSENILLASDEGSGLLAKVQNPDFGGLSQHAVISNKFLIDSALDSLRYFAPEQCSGEEVSAQTDVYALGIVFYEMLAGRVPFDAPTAAELIAKHKTQPPPDIKINNFDLRMLVTHTLMESLQKQPRFRQSSANAVARQLRHIEQLANHIATPPPIGVVPPAPARSMPRVSVSIDAATSATIAPLVTIETPVSRKVERTAPALEIVDVAELEFAAPIATPIAEVSAAPVFEREIFPEEPTQIPSVTHEVPVIEKFAEAEEAVPPPPRRSRMKVHRKRTHSKVFAAAFELLNKMSEPVGKVDTEISTTVEERITEIPVRLVTENATDAAPLLAEPRHIEWEQPEDDIPSVEDVMQVLRQERGEEMPVPQGEVEEFAARPAEIEAAVVIENARIEILPVIPVPEKIVTVSAEIKEIFAENAQAFAAPIEVAAPAPKTEPKAPVDVDERKTLQEIAPAFSVPVRIAPELKPQSKPRTRSTPATDIDGIDGQEEITLVRAPGNRIRIDLNKPRPWKKYSAGSPKTAFVPTILSDGKHGAIDPDVRDAMFADFYGQSRSRFITARRATALGGFLTLIVVFLFGNDLVTKYLQARSSDESAAVKTAETHKPSPTVGRTKSVKKSVRQNLREPRPESDKPVPAVTTATRKSEKSTPSTAESKPKAKTEPKVAPQKSAATPAKSAGATRPRIVP